MVGKKRWRQIIKKVPNISNRKNMDFILWKVRNQEGAVATIVCIYFWRKGLDDWLLSHSPTDCALELKSLNVSLKQIWGNNSMWKVGEKCFYLRRLGGCLPINRSKVWEIKQVEMEVNGWFSYGYYNFKLLKWYSDIQMEKSIGSYKWVFPPDN